MKRRQDMRDAAKRKEAQKIEDKPRDAIRLAAKSIQMNTAGEMRRHETKCAEI
jgi:hypothetical protein